MMLRRIVVSLLLVVASRVSAQSVMWVSGGNSSGGTVTSVAVTVPAFMTVSGSPLTTDGTLAFAFGSQSQSLMLASPCSGSGTPVFRSLCAADIPTLAQSQVTGLIASLAAAELTAHKNAANGYAGLDAGGKILSTQLPALAITDTYVVASQAAMLALTDAETGDVAIRTDTSQTYILRGTDHTLLSDWSMLATPADGVTSVAGRTGAVTLNVGDVSGSEATANKNAVSGYAGLNGSGNIAGTQITYGTTASTATEGNDSRLSNSRIPTAHASTHGADGSDPLTVTNAMLATGAVTDDKGSLAVKPSCGLVASSNVTLSGAQTIDGVAGTAGTTIVLATAQTTGSQNGPWIMQSGSWTRPIWYPSGGTSQAFQFITTLIRLGTVFSGTTWRITSSGAVTIDTTATTWAQAVNGTALAPTALAANGTNCSAGNYAAGVDASGNAEGCTAVPSSITNSAGANVIPKSNGTNLVASGVNDDGATITTTEAIAQTSASSSAFVSGPNGTTNPVFSIDNSTASQADGVSIKGLAAGAGTTITARSSGSNSPITLTPKGTGDVVISSAATLGGGVRIKNNSGVLSVRNVADSSDVGVLGTGFLGTNFGVGVAKVDGFAFNGVGGVDLCSTCGIEWSNASVSSSQRAGFGYSGGNTLKIVGTNSTGVGFLQNSAGASRVVTQFDVTSSVTLANVTGLSSTLAAGRSYRFDATLYTTSNIAGGVQAAIGGTATATNIIYEGYNVAGATINAQTRASAIGSAVASTTAVTAATIFIRGTITVNAGGTLTVQFAQNTSSVTASSVLVGSTFTVEDVQ